MNADSPSDRSPREQLVVDVDGTREMDPAEADRVLRECLSLTHKRLTAAIRPALAELQAATPQDPNAGAPVPEARALEREMAHAVRSKRELFVPCFRAEFEQAFQRRREGKLRTRGQRDESVALAMVERGAGHARGDAGRGFRARPSRTRAPARGACRQQLRQSV